MQGRVVGEGRYVLPGQPMAQMSQDGILIALAKREAGATQIGRTIYDPQAGQVMLTMKDGTSLAVKAGARVEQWEP
jgi:hypothetical protein